MWTPSRVGVRMPPFPFFSPRANGTRAPPTPTQPMPATALEHPVLPEMKQDVMSQDPSTAYLMEVLDNELEKKSFVELASLGMQAGECAVMQFEDGLQNLRLLVTSQENHMDGLICYHETEISNIRQSKEVLGAIKAGMIPDAEKLLGGVVGLKQGNRPEKIMQDYLRCLFVFKKIRIDDYPSSFLTDAMFLPTWDKIVGAKINLLGYQPSSFLADTMFASLFLE